MHKSVLNQQYKITEAYKGPYYTEGPVCDQEGNLYFTTISGGKIMKMKPDGEVKCWSEYGWPNGQRILTNGDHLVCDIQHAAVVRLDQKGKLLKAEASGEIGGIKIRTPNDLVVDQENGFYFTDSVRHDGVVFYKGFDGKESVVARNIDFANGIVLSEDKSFLLVAESYQNRILMIRLNDVGVAAAKAEVFAELPANEKPTDLDNLVETGNLPDGLAYDQHGNLWVAHYGMQALQVVDTSGNLIRSVETGIPATSNLCFSTPDYQSIMVSGGRNEPGPGMIHRILIQ